MHTIDIFVMIAYFSVLIIVGYIGSKRAKTSEDFILAGRNLGYFMFLGALAAVILGGASTIGTTKLGYEFGLSGIWLVFMLGLGIVVLGLFFSKKIFGLKVMTISELLEIRYNSETRLLSAVVAAIYAMMVAVTQVIGMGTILNVLLGWNLTSSMLLGGGIVLFYTILGGMWSVTMTDVLQFVVMTIGIFFIMLPTSLSKAGGWQNIQAKLPSQYFDWSSIGGDRIFQYFLLFALGMVVAQDIWQRLFTARTVKISKYGTVSAGIYSFLYALALSVIGMSTLVVLPNLEDSQNAFANMAMQTLPVGILGLVLAAVVSALMSTASGTLLASSTLIVNDIYKRFINPNINEKSFIKVSRMTTFIIGVLTIMFAIWIQDVLVALDVAYAVLSGAIFVPIVLGFYWKRVTAKAAFYSIVVSTIVIFVGLAIEGLTSTNPIMYGIGSSIVTILSLTFMTEDKDQNINHSL